MPTAVVIAWFWTEHVITNYGMIRARAKVSRLARHSLRVTGNKVSLLSGPSHNIIHKHNIKLGIRIHTVKEKAVADLGRFLGFHGTPLSGHLYSYSK